MGRIHGIILLKEPSMVIMIQKWIEGRVCGLMTTTKESYLGGRWTWETPTWSSVLGSQIETVTNVSCTSVVNERSNKETDALYSDM